MPEQYRSLIAILALATAVFAFAAAPACEVATSREDYARRRNLWFAITVTAFVANNFWIYIVVTAALLLWALPREKNHLALMYLLLFAVPPIQNDISGLGVIRYFFSIDYLRLIALVVLMPAWWMLRKQPDTPRFGTLVPDRFLIGLVVLQFCLMIIVSTVTNTLRIGAFYVFVDIFLPYYVASRGLKHLAQFREALMAFAVASLVLAAIGAFEFVWQWLLYSQVDDALGVRWGYGGYLPRGTTMRATASTGHSIVLGYVMAIAFGLLWYLRKSIANPAVWGWGVVAIGAGLIAALSRGPWVGAAVMWFVYVLTGPAPGKAIAQSFVGLVVAVPFLLFTSYGQEIIDRLPFVGSVDAMSVTYRQRLFEISVGLIAQNPIFGAYDFFYSPAMQELKQGSEGFIDLVNTYLGVGLSSGLTGLSMFVGFFVAVVWGIFRHMRQLADRGGELYLLGRVLIAVVLCIMVIIFTVSSITVIPIVYWSLAGVGVAYARMLATQAAPAAAPLKPAAPGMQRAGIRAAYYKSR